MNDTPLSHAESFRIGTVDFVSPDEIRVLLDVETPESVVVQCDGVFPFPRVHGYVLVPADDAYVVGQVEWITIERSPFPKRQGVKDFGLVDLPYPLRKMSVNPLGTLRKSAETEDRYTFCRGADALPSVGTSVLVPTKEQLRSIIESGQHRRVRIGTSPLAGNAEVCVDPDRLFGRHLAVLGNTGSGKSCSVAGLIRWSLEAARAERQNDECPNARFIILDPNGEYARAFSDGDLRARVFKVNPGQGELPLKVPLWFWNSAEWVCFSQATAKTQRPLLKRALREVKADRVAVLQSSEQEKRLKLRRFLSSWLITLQRNVQDGLLWSEETRFGFRLQSLLQDLEVYAVSFPDYSLTPTCTLIRQTLDARRKTGIDRTTGETYDYYRSFTQAEVEAIMKAIVAALEPLGGLIYQEGPDEDIPKPFSGTDLADHLEMLARQENVSQYVDFLVARIRALLADPRMGPIIGDTSSVTLEQWLVDYIGGENAKNGQIAIVDLSLVPTDVIYVITAVVARMVFEALQRYRKLCKTVLPTVLVMEEAHTFIKRYRDEDDVQEAAAVCCQVFERIAREGRKFGLGLVISSQRPSELSPTVLSQCNTFLLHRITNDRDQEIVHRLVPDSLRGLLRELPSLPSQHAILLGWASELPLLVRVDDLPESQRPQSDDPDFWSVWVRRDPQGNPVKRKVDWKDVARDWQQPSGENGKTTEERKESTDTGPGLHDETCRNSDDDEGVQPSKPDGLLDSF